MSKMENRNLSHKIDNIKTMCKFFGPYKAFRLWYFYRYIRSKKLELNFSEKIINVNGSKLHLVPNDEGISTELALFNVHEPLTTKIISDLLTNGMVCLDIGSNIGYYALLESKKIGPEGKVIAIEPSPINFQYLEKNVQMENADNIETHNFAAGSEDGKLKFLVSTKSNRSRTIPQEETVSPSTNEKIIEVPVKKLDNFLEEIGIKQLDFLRMDVEGFENYVYEGIKNSVKKFKPLIQMEIHKMYLGSEKTKKFLKELKEDGYDVLYYIPREMDFPLVGNMRDVKKIEIKKILEMIDNKTLPRIFSLFLENKN